MSKRILAFVLTALMCMYSALPLSISARAIDPVTAVYVATSLGHLAIEAYRLWREEHPNTPDSAYPGYNPGGSVSRVAGGTTIRDDGGSSSSGTWGDDPTPTPVDFESAYQEYTKTLPAPQINHTSSGNTLTWSPEWKFTSFSVGNPSAYGVYVFGDTSYAVQSSPYYEKKVVDPPDLPAPVVGGGDYIVVTVEYDPDVYAKRESAVAFGVNHTPDPSCVFSSPAPVSGFYTQISPISLSSYLEKTSHDFVSSVKVGTVSMPFS